MPDSYANQHLLDRAEQYDAAVEPGAYIPRKNEEGKIENWLNEIRASTDGREMQISGLARDREERLGWVIDQDATGLDVIASAGFLDDLEEAGYRGETFDDPGELQEYISETAQYGGLGREAYSVIEEAVLDDGKPLDEAVHAYLDGSGYTAFTVEGGPDHAVEQAMELLQLPYEERSQLHDQTNHVQIGERTTVTGLLDTGE
ncbi:MAG: hypothetical protein SVU32_04445 [Candidatus Nanohaloarchaea archaeon]|nr:hypothetical protein [Candidatus Nanohaloarchaea archaeon]